MRKIQRRPTGMPRRPLTLSIDPRVDDALKKYCERRGTSRSAVVEKFLADLLKVDLSIDPKAALLIREKDSEIAKLSKQLEEANQKVKALIRESIKVDSFSPTEG